LREEEWASEAPVDGAAEDRTIENVLSVIVMSSSSWFLVSDGLFSFLHRFSFLFLLEIERIRFILLLKKEEVRCDG